MKRHNTGQMKQANENLSIVLLDDDTVSLLHLRQLAANTGLANVVATFNSPQKFMEEFLNLKFDLLILDCEMPGMSGKEIIKKIGKDRCIVHTGSKHKYEEMQLRLKK
jgi:PleD family two-component response regulator